MNGISKVCPSNCSVKCTDCNVCIHMYYCNCIDAIIHHTICKHIHLVVRYSLDQTTGTMEDSLPQVMDDDDDYPLQAMGDIDGDYPPQAIAMGDFSRQAVDDCLPQAMDDYHPLLQALKKPNQNQLPQVKQRLLNKLSVLTTEITRCESIHALLSAEKCISSASHACRVMSPCKLPSTPRRIPPNKNRLSTLLCLDHIVIGLTGPNILAAFQLSMANTWLLSFALCGPKSSLWCKVSDQKYNPLTCINYIMQGHIAAFVFHLLISVATYVGYYITCTVYFLNRNAGVVL